MRPLQLCIFAALWAMVLPQGFAQSLQEKMQSAAEDYRRQDWSGAKEKFAKLIAESPVEPTTKAAWFYLGEAENQLKNPEAARAAYQNFLVLAEEHPHRELARYRLVEIAYLLGTSDAVSLCEGFLKAFPHSTWRAEVLGYLGQLRLIRNEPDLAERVFLRALEDFPQHPSSQRLRLGYATALIRLGKSQVARPIVKDIAASKDRVLEQRAKLIIALLDFEAGEQTLARSQLEEIVGSEMLTPAERSEIHVWLGRVIADAGETKLALTHYVRAIESGLVDPWLSVALNEWAGLHVRSGTPEVGFEELHRWKATPDLVKLDRALRELTSALEIRLSFEANRYPQTDTLVEQYRVSFPAGPNYRQVLEVAGRTAFAQGRFDEGVERFKELLAHPSNSPDEKASYHCQLAGIFLARKDFQSARQLLINPLDPQSGLQSRIQMQRLLAIVENSSGNSEGAKRILDELLSQPELDSVVLRRPILRELIDICCKLETFTAIRDCWPEFHSFGELQVDELPLVQKIADLAYRQADWALATDCYRELARKDRELSQQAAGWSGLAWTALAEGRTASARDSFEQLLELPVPEEAKAEAYLPLASLLEQDSQIAEAIGMYQRAITQADDPSIVGLAKFKCALRMQQLGGSAVVLEARDMLVDLESNPISAVPLDQVIYRLAWIDSDLGNDEEAEQRYNRILDEFPDSKLLPDVAYRLARVRLSRGEIELAEKLLSSIELETLPVELRERLVFLQGQLAAKQEKWPIALAAMSELAEKTEDEELRQTASYWRAEACFQLGRWAEATEQFEHVLGFENSKLDHSAHRQAALRKAESLLASENWTSALEAIEQARAGNIVREDRNQWPELELVAGRALFAGGRLGDAISAFKTAIDYAPVNSETAAQAQWRIGESWLAQERYVEALEAYLRTVSQYPFPHWRAAALLQAGKCQERLGNLNQALKLYKQLEDEYPTSEFATQAKRRIDAVERRARADEIIRR